MLPKEKQRAGWSLAVGVVVAGLVAGYSYFQAFEANQRLHSLIAECKKQFPLSLTGGSVAHPTSAQTADDPLERRLIGSTEMSDAEMSALVCDPVDLEGGGLGLRYVVETPVKPPEGTPIEPLRKGETEEPVYSPLQTNIIRTAMEAREAENDQAQTGRRSAFIVFLIFCLPLIWYLVLDRIREISAAIAGRDRSS